ncbi:hypothetical protein PRK78_007313 [Emydomyces testavorans]|uniref:Uncharacterized protein n=1 Tax=Emydomyces testavorans TaxID=2070801 RepID=A0AAF0DNH4_9EURO|nr:hypothetical protein PRK78_007313 [Emydomyces testavorans]
MKAFAFIMFFLQALLVCAQAASKEAANPKLEKLSIATGDVVNTAEPHSKAEKASRSFGDVIEVDPKKLTAAIPPGSLDNGHGDNRKHARDLTKRQCPMSSPWLCDGVTCFNRSTHMCCRGGYLCGGSSVCVLNALRQIACR